MAEVASRGSAGLSSFQSSRLKTVRQRDGVQHLVFRPNTSPLVSCWPAVALVKACSQVTPSEISGRAGETAARSVTEKGTYFKQIPSVLPSMDVMSGICFVWAVCALSLDLRLCGDCVERFCSSSEN